MNNVARSSVERCPTGWPSVCLVGAARLALTWDGISITELEQIIMLLSLSLALSLSLTNIASVLKLFTVYIAASDNKLCSRNEQLRVTV